MNHSEAKEIKRYFDVVAESLRSDIKAIAEGHIISNRKIDTLREENAKEHEEFRQEMASLRKDLFTLREENAKEHEEFRQEMASLREENAKEHREILLEIKSSYADLDHRVSALEKR